MKNCYLLSHGCEPPGVGAAHGTIATGRRYTARRGVPRLRRWGTTISTGLGEICAEKPDGFPEKEGREAEENERRSEEHTSELQSLMRSSYAVFCLNKKNTKSKKLRQ